MKKILILVLFNINLVLYANEPIYTDAKVAIQMIGKNNTVFISTEKMKNIIRGSRTINISSLFSSSILGKMPCSPLYSCPMEVEKQLSKFGIKRDDFLVLYDNSFGVYASTLYTLLESLGHQNMTILNGGIESILNIDPNQKLYDKYMNEITNLTKKEESSIEDIQKKLDILKPHLLIQKQSLKLSKSVKKDSYQIKKGNLNFLLSVNGLKELVSRVEAGDKNITIVDSCPMVDIVGDRYGSYEVGVTPFSWKKLIEAGENKIKSKEELNTLFKSFPKERQYALYCMENSNKALFMMTVMRYIGFNKIKAFTGNWSVWTRDKVLEADSIKKADKIYIKEK